MSLPPFNQGPQSKFTQPPNPAWSYGQKVDSTSDGQAWLEGEKHGWKTINTAEHDRQNLYKLLISGIVPRPIAFVGSISEDGVENLAPFSWFNSVSAWPPIISIGINNAGPGKLKDTARNIRSGNDFTVNIISESFIENANVTSIDAPPDFEEWSISGLTKVPSLHVKASRVKESALSLECELYKAIDIIHPTTGEFTSTLVLGHIKYIHVRNDVLTEAGTVDITKLRPIARLGDITYGRIGDVFRLTRPAWGKDESIVRETLQRL